jgi:hypothetical protein
MKRRHGVLSAVCVAGVPPFVECPFLSFWRAWHSVGSGMSLRGEKTRTVAKKRGKAQVET